MIKVSRNGVDVKVTYTDESDREHTATAFCKNVESAQELADEVREAIKQGYGFAKCRAILEGDTVRTHGGKREGAGRPPAEEPRKARTFKATDTEWKEIQARAKKAGMNASEYIRGKTLNA